MPADDQEIVLPCASVIVIIVLLNEAFTCATPDTMFLRSRRRTRVASLAMSRFDPSGAPVMPGAGDGGDLEPETGRAVCRAGVSESDGLDKNATRIGIPGSSLRTAPDAAKRVDGLLLLAGDRLRLALAGAGVGVRALAADRQLAAVPQAAVAAPGPSGA